MTRESTLRDALVSAFDDDYAVCGRLREGGRNTVYEASVNGRRAACKLTDRHPEMLVREGTVLTIVAEHTPVPVPEVLHESDGVLVLEWAGGERYEDVDARHDRCARLRGVGRTLARLHRATTGWFDGHGALKSGCDPLVVDDPTDWSDRLTTFVDDWASDLAGTNDADVGAAVAEFVADHRDAFAGRPPVLVHGEPGPEHVRFDRNEVCGLLDWEIAQAAPGPFDLVWAERDFLRTPLGSEVDGRLRVALHEGYEAELPPSPGARFRREVYRAAFAMRDMKHVTERESDTGVDGVARRGGLRSYVYDRLDAAESMGIPDR